MKKAQLALGTKIDESTRTRANSQAQNFAVEESLSAERARVERLERDITADAGKRQHLLAERQETNQTASRQLVEDGESLQELQPEVATVTVKLKE